MLRRIFTENLGDELAVRVREERPSRREIHLFEGVKVGYISVVGDGQRPVPCGSRQRLGVAVHLRSGRRVSYVTYAYGPVELAEHVFGEGSLDKPAVLDRVYGPLRIIYRYSSTLLSAVLDYHERFLQSGHNVVFGADPYNTATVFRPGHISHLIVALGPGVAPELGGFTVSAGSACALPHVVRAFSAPAAWDVSPVAVVSPLCRCSSSHCITPYGEM